MSIIFLNIFTASLIQHERGHTQARTNIIHTYVVTAEVAMTISPRHVCCDCLVTYRSQFHSPLTGPATHTANATPKPHPKFTDVRGVKPLPPRIHCAQDPKPNAYKHTRSCAKPLPMLEREQACRSDVTSSRERHRACVIPLKNGLPFPNAVKNHGWFSLMLLCVDDKYICQIDKV